MDEFLHHIAGTPAHPPKYDGWGDDVTLHLHVNSFLKANAEECAYMCMRCKDDEAFNDCVSELVVYFEELEC